MDNVDSSDLDGYVDGINQLLTTKAKTKNRQIFDALKQTYKAAKVKGTGKVLSAGWRTSTPTRPTVLVAHDATVTTSAGHLQHYYRWNVELVKVDGKWLVDDFNPVN